MRQRAWALAAVLGLLAPALLAQETGDHSATHLRTLLIKATLADPGSDQCLTWDDSESYFDLLACGGGALDDLSDVTITAAAQGEILAHNGTAFVDLGVGTSGQFLTTNGAGANVSWTTATSLAGYEESGSDPNTLLVATAGNTSGRLSLPSGSKTIPTYGFSADLDTGIYYFLQYGAHRVRIVSNGVDVGQFMTDGLYGGATGAAKMLMTSNPSATVPGFLPDSENVTGLGGRDGYLSLIAESEEKLRVADPGDVASAQWGYIQGPTRTTGSADNDEAYLTFNLDVDDGQEEMARIAVVAPDVTTATEDGYLAIWGRDAGAAVEEVARFTFRASEQQILVNDVCGACSNPEYSYVQDPDSGWGRFGTNLISGVVGGTTHLTIFSSQILAEMDGTAAKPAWSFDNDRNVGLRRASDALLLVAGAIDGLTLTELSSGVVLQYETSATLTASTTQTQGQEPLVSTVNEVSVVANANDTVTLPSALAGSCVRIINNGANTLRIFPASGDDAGAGVDTQVTLASGSNVHYCAYDATTWETF